MKTFNYTGSSKLISRIVYLLNRKAPLPLNGDGDPSWGTNGQVLSTDGTGNTAWVNQGGGGDVTDVEVNGTSVVNAQGVAEVSVPTKTSDLNNDSDFVSDASYVHTDNNYTSTEKTKLGGIAAGAEVNVQADWNETDNTSDAYIANKPTIPAAQVQSDWNQSDSTAVDYIKNKPSIPSGGDTVSWTQVQQSGTKIAEIDINGSTQDVYAPNGGSAYTEGDGIDITNNEISVDTAFTEASARANIASGDTLATIWGKIKKYFTDLKTVAFSGSYNDLSNKPTIPTDFVSKANGGTFEGNIAVNRHDGTTSSVGITEIVIGNNKGQGVDKNSRGFLYLFSTMGKWARVRNDNGTANQDIYLPDKSGTVALTSDITSTLLLDYATPFYMTGAQGTRIRFTFTGLSDHGSIHLLIFGRYSSADILAACSSTGFSSIKTSPITADSTYNMGISYNPNNGYTFTVQVGAWSDAWGIFIHPSYPNATMTMARET